MVSHSPYQYVPVPAPTSPAGGARRRPSGPAGLPLRRHTHPARFSDRL